MQDIYAIWIPIKQKLNDNIELVARKLLEFINVCFFSVWQFDE